MHCRKINCHDSCYESFDYFLFCSCQIKIFTFWFERVLTAIQPIITFSVTIKINQVLFNYYTRELSVSRKDLRAVTWMGLNWENPVIDPLSVHHVNNRIFITAMGKMAVHFLIEGNIKNGQVCFPWNRLPKISVVCEQAMRKKELSSIIKWLIFGLWFVQWVQKIL